MLQVRKQAYRTRIQHNGLLQTTGQTIPRAVPVCARGNFATCQELVGFASIGDMNMRQVLATVQDPGGYWEISDDTVRTKAYRAEYEASMRRMAAKSPEDFSDF